MRNIFKYLYHSDQRISIGSHQMFCRASSIGSIIYCLVERWWRARFKGNQPHRKHPPTLVLLLLQIQNKSCMLVVAYTRVRKIDQETRMERISARLPFLQVYQIVKVNKVNVYKNLGWMWWSTYDNRFAHKSIDTKPLSGWCKFSISYQRQLWRGTTFGVLFK